MKSAYDQLPNLSLDETMEYWLDCISYATMILLENPDPAEAFCPYESYMEDAAGSGE